VELSDIENEPVDKSCEPLGQEIHNPDLTQLDDALKDLAKIDEQQSRLVELRFFGGLTVEEAAEVLGISRSTAKRDWNVAKAWLSRELKRGTHGEA
jgi:RNA polymerase sigma factor (sigma-70 family)